MKDGSIDAPVAQDPFKMCFEAVKSVVDMLDGKTPPKRIDLQAVVITKADLDKPDIQALLNPDLKKYLKESVTAQLQQSRWAGTLAGQQRSLRSDLRSAAAQEERDCD